MNAKFYADSESVDRKAKNKLFTISGEKRSFPALITVCLRFFSYQYANKYLNISGIIKHSQRVQGGSDKSGKLKTFLENHTA